MANVLILGATSLVATRVAHIYAQRGHSLYLVGRSEEKLEALVKELAPCVLGSARLDACDTEQSEATIREAFRLHGGFDVALIAHGWLGDQLRAESDVSHALAILEVNFCSVVAELVVLQQLFAAQGRGKIAVCSTVAADRGRPRNFCYGAAKAGLNTYLEGMRAVLLPRVSVHTLKLGPVDTPMTTDHPKNFSFSTADATASGIVRALDHNRAVAYIPSWWFWVMLVVRNLPHWIFSRISFLSGR